MQPDRTGESTVPPDGGGWATAADLWRMLAAADAEMLPTPRQVDTNVELRILTVALADAAGSRLWWEWWMRHGWDGRAGSIQVDGTKANHLRTGWWRGWTVELVHTATTEAVAR